MNASVSMLKSAELAQANALMIEALVLLDKHQHIAAPHVDYALVLLGLRSAGEGMPPGI